MFHSAWIKGKGFFPTTAAVATERRPIYIMGDAAVRAELEQRKTRKTAAAGTIIGPLPEEAKAEGFVFEVWYRSELGNYNILDAHWVDSTNEYSHTWVGTPTPVERIMGHWTPIKEET